MKHETIDNAIEGVLFKRFYNLVDRISKHNKTYPTARYIIKGSSVDFTRMLAVDDYENGYQEYWESVSYTHLTLPTSPYV